VPLTLLEVREAPEGVAMVAKPVVALGITVPLRQAMVVVVAAVILPEGATMEVPAATVL
jgi:hypothetical protein